MLKTHGVFVFDMCVFLGKKMEPRTVAEAKQMLEEKQLLPKKLQIRKAQAMEVKQFLLLATINALQSGCSQKDILNTLGNTLLALKTNPDYKANKDDARVFVQQDLTQEQWKSICKPEDCPEIMELLKASQGLEAL